MKRKLILFIVTSVIVYLLGYIYYILLTNTKKEVVILGIYPPKMFFIDEIHHDYIYNNSENTKFLSVYKVLIESTAGDGTLIFSRDHNSISFIDKHLIESSKTLEGIVKTVKIRAFVKSDIVCEEPPPGWFFARPCIL